MYDEMMRENPHNVCCRSLYGGKIWYFDPMDQMGKIVSKLPKKMWIYDEKGRLYTIKRDQNGNDYRVYFYPYGSYGKESI